MMNYDEINRYFLEEKEKTEIRLVGQVVGICIIAYVVLQNLLSIPIMYEPFLSAYKEEGAFYYSVVIFLSVTGILVPFLLGGKYLKKRFNTDIYKLSRPVNTEEAIYLVCFAFFVCLAGNFLSSWITTFVEATGVNLSSPEYKLPSSVNGRIIYIIATAVVPALAEEIAIRGVVLQSLRKYGNIFAIVASSLIFAIMHGNLIQAPFALIAGMALGYVVCLTDSLWIGIIIHFLNNFYSVIVTFLISDIKDEALLNQVYLIILSTLYVITILGSFMFFKKKDRTRLVICPTYLPESKKYLSLILNIPMIISLIIMLIITSNYVSKA